MARRRAWLGVIAVALSVGPARVLSGQEATPPPGPGLKAEAGGPVHELLPDLGRIGAQVGLAFGPSWNPYQVGRGLQGGGYADLPLLRAPGGKLSYEILVM